MPGRRDGKMDIDALAARVASGLELTPGEARTILDWPLDRVAGLARAALCIKEQAFPGTVEFCAIVNAKSGSCSEDCAFCAQSALYATASPHYPLLDEERILQAARRMKAAGARRFSIVTSGKGLSGADLARVAAMLPAIRDLGLEPDASLGVLSPDQLRALRQAGLSAYHHNLETARSFFPRICTTHDYEEDVAVVRAAKEAGLCVCSGGLFGLGESWDQRLELALTLRELGVDSVPVNFLSPIPGTPLASRPVMTPEEALKTVALLRFVLPRAQVRICGGRSLVFGPRKAELLASGASGIMVGDYLTTRGADLDSDREDVRRLGLSLG
jgi:biotin synthase